MHHQPTRRVRVASFVVSVVDLKQRPRSQPASRKESQVPPTADALITVRALFNYGRSSLFPVKLQGEGIYFRRVRSVLTIAQTFLPTELLDKIICDLLQSDYQFQVISGFASTCRAFRRIALRCFFMHLRVSSSERWRLIPNLTDMIKSVKFGSTLLYCAPESYVGYHLEGV